MVGRGKPALLLYHNPVSLSTFGEIVQMNATVSLHLIANWDKKMKQKLYGFYSLRFKQKKSEWLLQSYYTIIKFELNLIVPTGIKFSNFSTWSLMQHSYWFEGF